jgi:hypothetical protein
MTITTKAVPLVAGLALALTAPVALADAGTPTGKAAMSAPPSCKHIKNKKKRNRCERRHGQG